MVMTPLLDLMLHSDYPNLEVQEYSPADKAFRVKASERIYKGDVLFIKYVNWASCKAWTSLTTWGFISERCSSFRHCGQFVFGPRDRIALQQRYLGAEDEVS